MNLGDEAYTLTSLKKIQEHISEGIQRQAHIFSIVDLHSDELIGRCMLFNLDQVNRSAMLGILIGEKSYQNQGYGQEAVRLLLDYAFNLLNLHNVMLGVFSFNESAIHCYRKVGFKEIGRRRECTLYCAGPTSLALRGLPSECCRTRWYLVRLGDNVFNRSILHAAARCYYVPKSQLKPLARIPSQRLYARE